MSGTPDTSAQASSVQAWLERAGAWMFASLTLQPPDAARIGDMTALVPTLPFDVRETAAAIAACPVAEWEPEFFSVLGPGGCPASESSYERAAMASRGPIIAEVAGYYRAFAYPGDRLGEVPDHLSVELGFLSFLAMKVAFARFAARAGEEAIAREAYDRFCGTHVLSWLDSFCGALVSTDSLQYGVIARYLALLESTQVSHR